MNCQKIHAQLDSYLDGELGTDQLYPFQAHLKGCQQCRKTVEQAEAIQGALAELPAPSLRPGFAQQAIRRVVGKRHQRRGFMIGFSSALAAGLALFVVSTGLLPTINNSTSLPDVAVAVGTVHTINLAFDSASAAEKVTLTITLPDNIELAGYPGLKQLTWQTSLKQGRNILPLPIKTLTQHGGVLQASIESSGKTKSFQAPIQATQQRQPQASETRPELVKV